MKNIYRISLDLIANCGWILLSGGFLESIHLYKPTYFNINYIQAFTSHRHTLSRAMRAGAIWLTPGMEYLLDDPNELGRLLRLLRELMKILETYGVLDHCSTVLKKIYIYPQEIPI